MGNRPAVKIFIDTWGWLALRDRREDRHEEIKDRCLDLRGRGYSFYTSDYVLDETFTLLFRRLRFEADFTSMVVMAELGITDILTEDEHFTQVSMGFQKVP
jgi:predicted nucleic acid-binding protein